MLTLCQRCIGVLNVPYRVNASWVVSKFPLPPARHAQRVIAFSFFVQMVAHRVPDKRSKSILPSLANVGLSQFKIIERGPKSRSVACGIYLPWDRVDKAKRAGTVFVHEPRGYPEAIPRLSRGSPPTPLPLIASKKAHTRPTLGGKDMVNIVLPKCTSRTQ